MLLQFNFKNYKSFRDDTTLDLTATKISEFDKHIIKTGGEQVLPIAAIFGANASGKSNVIEAFRYMHEYVMDSLNYGGDTSKKEKDGFVKPTPFLFDNDTKDAESVFEVYFIDFSDSKEKTYNYGFSIDTVGVVEEWLNVKSKTAKEASRIFYRNRNTGELDLTGFTNKVKDNLIIALEKETLLVSLGAKLKVDKLKFVRDWFMNNEFANFGQPVENFFLSQLISEDFAEDENVRKKVLKYLSSFDESIVDFKVETIRGEKEEDDRIKIFAVHQMVDGTGFASIPLQHESAGTLKMFALYPWVEEVLSIGGILVIDELNAKLHPLLVRVFSQTFLNKELNPNNAQLIFTTHDSWQLNANLLRRDEIWFTEKQANGISQLYSLADFVDEDGVKIRKDENYEKNYLLGKYGAIPTLKYFDLFKEE
ncbi:MAG: ATP-binding protein [Anaeroplasmataceae bacterium]|nr:ATP-binding protein [Anaeroplasmataceae bacterium]